MVAMAATIKGQQEQSTLHSYPLGLGLLLAVLAGLAILAILASLRYLLDGTEAWGTINNVKMRSEVICAMAEVALYDRLSLRCCGRTLTFEFLHHL